MPYCLSFSVYGSDVVRAALSPMGSLAADPVAYSDMVVAMYEGDDQGALYIAEELITEAVPEEGEIHPVRATVTALAGSESGIVFVTPGGVSVTIRPQADGQVSVDIGFNRDSQSLCWQVVSRLVEWLDWRATVFLDSEELSLAEAVQSLAASGLRRELAALDRQEAARSCRFCRGDETAYACDCV